MFVNVCVWCGRVRDVCLNGLPCVFKYVFRVVFNIRIIRVAMGVQRASNVCSKVC